MAERYFMELAYKGTNYCGWQRQPNGLAVQEVLEDAFSLIMRKEVPLVAAGRTDAGVHASCMVAHFDLESPLGETPEMVVKRLNGVLPPDVVVRAIWPVPTEMHARFSAVARRYEYHFLLRKSPFAADGAWYAPYALDFAKMAEAAATLFDYEDFTSFSKVQTDVKTHICYMREVAFERRGEQMVFVIEANRFLRNMVRAIVGTLVEVGRGRMTVQEFRHVVEAKNRNAAGISVPACGLYLVDVKY